MHFQIAGLCFTNDVGSHFEDDPVLVGLSYVIAVVGSYAALEMIERWRRANGARARAWRIASAATLGGSVWSMHFIGMLAVRFDMPLTYALSPTLLSLLTAIVAVGLGLQILQDRPSHLRVGFAGIVVGMGIATMHYVGMASLRFPGTLAYLPSLWGLSLLIAITAATVALWLSLKLQTQWHRVAAAFVMGAAICGMHYTGMASTEFQVDPLLRVTPGVPPYELAVAIAVATLALILSSLICVAADRVVLASAKRETDLLRAANARLMGANGELERGRQQLDAVLSNIAQGVCLFDADQRLLVWNRRYEEIYDLPPGAVQAHQTLEEIVTRRSAAGSAPPDMSPAEYLALCQGIVANLHASSSTVTLHNGRTISVNYQPLREGGWVATHEDITERKRAEGLMLFMARHDALTRLPNRLLFHERLEHAVSLAGRGAISAIHCLDLDRFKLINDTLGHPVGDALLVSAADRLLACVRETDTVARLGGDEFAIIQFSLAAPHDAELLAARIIAAFREPFDLDEHHINIGTSIGVALVPNDGTDPDKLLKSADIALYLAKQEGRNTVRFFEPEMDARILLRRALELDLRGAIARSEFEVHYQPIVNLSDMRISGFEALLRWHHPQRGLVSPADFIPLAEDTGLIAPIDDWVLKTACLDAVRWPSNVTLAVNVSAVQFKKGTLLATVKAALAESGLPPGRLELEITETVLLQETSATLNTLRQLRTMGIGVALDDFGTGYSSLSHLRNFPFSKIKIDRSFVSDLMVNTDAVSIVRAVADLGHSLRVKTTAEGVETLEQLEHLREEGSRRCKGSSLATAARLTSWRRCSGRKRPRILHRRRAWHGGRGLMMSA